MFTSVPDDGFINKPKQVARFGQYKILSGNKFLLSLFICRYNIYIKITQKYRPPHDDIVHARTSARATFNVTC